MSGLKWEDHVKFDEKYYRPTEVDELLADASKAREQLGWTPKVKFRDLVRIMVDYRSREARHPVARGGEADLERLGMTWIRG